MMLSGVLALRDYLLYLLSALCLWCLVSEEEAGSEMWPRAILHLSVLLRKAICRHEPVIPLILKGSFRMMEQAHVCMPLLKW